MRYFLLLAFFLLGACTTGGEQAHISFPDQCQTPFVVLPGNYIIDLAAGSEITLNPVNQPFALFCTPQDAKDALQGDMDSGQISGTDDWRVYELEGSFDQLARPCGHGQYCLATPARVLDWLP